MGSESTRKLIDRLQEKKNKIQAAQSRTDSDMYHYFSDMEWDRIDSLQRKLYSRAQRQEMKEWNI